MSTVRGWHEIRDELFRQEELWGEQNHPDGTDGPGDVFAASQAKWLCEYKRRRGTLAWRDILTEEIAEAFAESDPDLLRMELIQVAAVALNWVGAIDRKKEAE